MKTLIILRAFLLALFVFPRILSGQTAESAPRNAADQEWLSVLGSSSKDSLTFATSWQKVIATKFYAQARQQIEALVPKSQTATWILAETVRGGDLGEQHRITIILIDKVPTIHSIFPYEGRKIAEFTPQKKESRQILRTAIDKTLKAFPNYPEFSFSRINPEMRGYYFVHATLHTPQNTKSIFAGGMSGSHREIEIESLFDVVERYLVRPE